MRLKPNTWALTALLALLTSLGPLSTDMYLPSLPAIGTALEAGTPAVQLTLSAYLLGFAAGQIVYGPLSDRYGRRPVLLGAIAIFVLASGACAAAPSIEWLVSARFAQALGGAGPIVLARSVVRDLYGGARAGQELARMGTIMGVVPLVAPVLGGLLHEALGWRSNFLAMLLFGLGAAALVWAALPETLRTRAPELVTPRQIARIYGGLLAHRGYAAFVASACLIFAGLFAFISASSFVLQGLYGLSPLGYSLCFSVCVLGYILGTLLGGALVRRLGMSGAHGLGAGLLASGGLTMLCAVLTGFGHPAEIVAPMMLYFVGVGVALPQAVAGAMMPFPDRAGSASSLLGFCQMSFAALVGVAVGQALGGSALPLALAVALTGLAALLLHAMTRRARAAALANVTE